MKRWSLLWNEDCLNVTTILALSLEPRKLKRLARQFALLDEGHEADLAEIFEMLHEACHHNTAVAKTIAKELDDRFKSTLLRVRSNDLAGIKEIKMNWPLPLLWAVLRDERPEVRAHGRLLTHALLWESLRNNARNKEDVSDIENEKKSFEAQISAQKTELNCLKVELQKKTAENQKLQRLLTVGRLDAEKAKPNEPGAGRLTREIRKLRHELEMKRERVQNLEKLVGDSPHLLPKKLSLEIPLRVASESAKSCFAQGRDTLQDQLCSRKNNCCNECPLEGLRVAIVGGLSKMAPEYREVVRQLGAELLLHDGEVKNGSYKLKSVICGADIVVFITSVNSHGALSVVRAVCKKKGKKFIALRETGSESLAKTLRNFAA